MENCIFCQIVAGKIPAMNVYEDDLFLGFLDITPRAKGHTLLIPKKHYRWVYDVPEFSAYWETAKKITEKMKEVLHCDFVTYITYGMDVPHAHIHIMPRYGSEKVFPDVIKMDKEEMNKIAESLFSAFK